jgi:Fic family protein
MELEIIKANLLQEFVNKANEKIEDLLKNIDKEKLPVDYFQFYNSVSSVYSSKIEGEEIDFDSFYKHKFMNVRYQANYTQRAEDLFAAYTFIENKELNFENTRKAHKIISAHLLPDDQQGRFRNNPMFVINSDDRIEYVAAEPDTAMWEMEKLFRDIAYLLSQELNTKEVFYYASMIHLVFVKIHPFQDGNGRIARLMEKWFLISKLGRKANAIQLEKNYYQNLSAYYSNIKKLGLEYIELDFDKAMDFLLMTIDSISKNHNN